MSTPYIKRLLPDWIIVEGNLEAFTLLPPLQFQLEWEENLAALWDELTASEKEKITPPEAPYTEAGISDFMLQIKKLETDRGVFDSILSLFDEDEERRFPRSLELERRFLSRLKQREHCVFDSRLILLDPCEFMMGGGPSHHSQPIHSVKIIRRFAMGKYPVTQEIWTQIMGSNPSQFRGLQRKRHPVENISWFEAIQFCNKLNELEGLEQVYEITETDVTWNVRAKGYRLPTEAEWEYCARANQKYRYSGSNNIKEVAWYRFNSVNSTHRIGEKEANAFGFYDMNGNVDEWCWDEYEYYQEGDAVDPRKQSLSLEKSRVFRGGNWGTIERNISVFHRGAVSPSNQFNLGVRICRTL